MTLRQDDGRLAALRCAQPKRLAFAGERIAGITLETLTQAGRRSRELTLHLAARNSSPTGFEWGDSGSDAVQLLIAMCIEPAGRDRAEHTYHSVKHRLVALIKGDVWIMRCARVLETIEQPAQSDRRLGSAA